MSRAPPRDHLVHQTLRCRAQSSASPISDSGGYRVSKCFHRFMACACRRVVATGNSVLWSICCSCQALWYRDSHVPMEVLVAEHGRRHRIGCQLRTGLHQLQLIVEAPDPAHIAIIVQQVIATDRQLAGCYQLGQRPDGAPYALLRLALEVNGLRLGSDELLAALAEQWIGLANLRDAPSVLVPVDFEPTQPNPASRSPSLPPDPLSPFPDGRRPHRA